jgi:uncharacterized protein Yka (UPF0111/DUF47 family)
MKQADDLDNKIKRTTDPNELSDTMDDMKPMMESLDHIMNKDLPEINKHLDKIEHDLDNLDQKKMV